MWRVLYGFAPLVMALPVRAETTSMDCLPPLRPELSASVDLMRDYGDELRTEFTRYFDESQTYLNCLAAAQRSAQEEIQLVLDAYREMFQ